MAATVQTGPHVGTGGDERHRQLHLSIALCRRVLANPDTKPLFRALASSQLRKANAEHGEVHHCG
jgi:hypothetical protein